jgi:membrane associated rhomboid family serine protease
MLGVQVAHDWVRRRQLHYNLFRRWAPIAVGAALLAWLGGDGRQIDPNALPKAMNELNVQLPKIDVWAHLLGFAAGLALGGFIGWSRPRFRLSLRLQAVPAAAALGLFALAWWLALR